MFESIKALVKDWLGIEPEPDYPIPVGTRVLVRSNEPDPYIIGTLVEYKTKEGTMTKYHLPVIEDDKGTIWYCFGIVKEYSEELRSKLDTMPPIEQYNYLSCRHAQIEEKYGIEYKTYKCNCESCLEHAELLKDFK